MSRVGRDPERALLYQSDEYPTRNTQRVKVSIHNECAHALGVSVEIELKMDWQGCEQV